MLVPKQHPSISTLMFRSCVFESLMGLYFLHPFFPDGDSSEWIAVLSRKSAMRCPSIFLSMLIMHGVTSWTIVIIELHISISKIVDAPFWSWIMIRFPNFDIMASTGLMLLPRLFTAHGSNNRRAVPVPPHVHIPRSLSVISSMLPTQDDLSLVA